MRMRKKMRMRPAVSGEIVLGRVTGKMEEERTDDNPDRI